MSERSVETMDLSPGGMSLPAGWEMVRGIDSSLEEIHLGLVLIDGVPAIRDQHGRKVHGLGSWYYGGWDSKDEDRTLTLVTSVAPEAWDEMVRIVESHSK